MNPQNGLSLEISLNAGRIGISIVDTRGAIHPHEDKKLNIEAVDALCLQIRGFLEKYNEVGEAAVYPAGFFDALKEKGCLLYDYLFPLSVKQRLRLSGAEHLILRVDESLSAIPWHLIYDGTQFLGLRFALGVTVRISHEMADDVALREPVLPLKMLILADPEGNLSGQPRKRK